MSGIYQRKSTPSGIASPSADSVFMGVDTSGVFYTKDESGTVTVYPTEGGTFTGGTVSSLSATTLSSTTLNVDFTDNLQFKTDSDFESISLDPVLNIKFIGDYIGLENTSATLSGYTGTGYAGMGVGVLDWGNGSAQTGYVGSINGFALDDNTASTFKIMGLLDLDVFGNGVFFQNAEQVTFSGSSGTKEIYNRTQIDLDNEQARMDIGLMISDTDDNLIGEFYLSLLGQNESGSQMFFGKLNSSDEFIELILDENATGFEIYNGLSDDTASLFKILDNNSTNIFDVRNNGVLLPNLPTSDPVNAGQLWLDGTTLKVSAGV